MQLVSMKKTLFILLTPLLTAASGLLSAETLRVLVQDAASGQPLADAVVELLAPLSITVNATLDKEVEIDQQDKEFVPGVTVIVKDSRINFPNSDDILHHVYSFSAAKTFDIPLYGQSNAEYTELFDIAGVIEIGCNIHDWMLAYIYIADSALAAKSDAQGEAVIANLQPGSYRLKIWHPLLQGTYAEQSLQVNADSETAFTASITVGKDRRIRRAPSSTRNRYR